MKGYYELKAINAGKQTLGGRVRVCVYVPIEAIEKENIVPGNVLEVSFKNTGKFEKPKGRFGAKHNTNEGRVDE